MTPQYVSAKTPVTQKINMTISAHRCWRLRVRPRRAPLLLQRVDKIKLRGPRAAPPSQRPRAGRASPRRAACSDSTLIRNTLVQPPLVTTTAAAHPPFPRQAYATAATATTTAAHPVRGFRKLLVRRRGGGLFWCRRHSRGGPERGSTPMLRLTLQLLLVLHQLLAEQAPTLEKKCRIQSCRHRDRWRMNHRSAYSSSEENQPPKMFKECGAST